MANCSSTSCESPALVQWQRKHPTEDGSTTPVYACFSHAISGELGAQMHESTCSAPPACNCTPTPIVPLENGRVAALTPLPEGW